MARLAAVSGKGVSGVNASAEENDTMLLTSPSRHGAASHAPRSTTAGRPLTAMIAGAGDGGGGGVHAVAPPSLVYASVPERRAVERGGAAGEKMHERSLEASAGAAALTIRMLLGVLREDSGTGGRCATAQMKPTSQMAWAHRHRMSRSNIQA